MSLRILLVEDEPGLVLTLSDLLTEAGYEVDSASDGATGLDKGLNGHYDLIILDWMMPRMAGVEVCRRLRESGVGGSIMMLTARAEVANRIEGLQTGADDYLTKPFHPDELLARVQALLRRFGKEERPHVNTFEFDGIAVNFERGELVKHGKPVPLGGKELQLLRYLITNRGETVTREELLQKVWEYNGDVESRTLDVHVAWLRQKLEDSPQTPRHIHTVRGKGYRFTP